VLELEDAALYQGLHRMESKGWIEAEWGRTDTGRRAKLYRLTPSGRKRLVAGSEGWRSYAAAVLKVLEASGARGPGLPGIRARERRGDDDER
jgi:DNA-binding PadR family transcriptional regulator